MQQMVASGALPLHPLPGTGAAWHRLGATAAKLILPISGLLVILALWAIGVRILDDRVPLAHLFAPSDAFANLYRLLVHGDLTGDIIASLRRVGISLALALMAGIPLGLAVGSWHRFDAGTSCAFQFLRMISPLSWMPIAVMVFGIGDAPIYFLLAITAVWPIVLNTATGVRQLDPRWLALAKSLSATPREALTKIVLPGILGNILTGVRIAIGIIWILLVPCEMLGVTSGLGYFVLDTRDRLAYSELMAVILLIGLMGFALDLVARQVHRHWTHGAA